MVETALVKRFWPDMCAAYRDADLAKACLGAQERWSADVPLLLVLCIADRAGFSLSKTAVLELTAAAQSWRETTIWPLRRIRQSMKGRFNDPAEVGLRDDIKRLELEAERLHVNRMASWFADLDKGDVPAAQHYLALCGASSVDADAFISIFNHAYNLQVMPAFALD